ncbi:MAG: hypothetical protein WC445_02215 [Patescibacteria group bacterium]
MGGLSGRQVRKILAREFPEINCEIRRAIEIAFSHLVNRLSLVRFAPPLDYLLFVDPELTTRCLVRLVCADIQAGGNAPIYLRVKPIEGGVGGDEGWVEIEFREWPSKI